MLGPASAGGVWAWRPNSSASFLMQPPAMCICSLTTLPCRCLWALRTLLGSMAYNTLIQRWLANQTPVRASFAGEKFLTLLGLRRLSFFIFSHCQHIHAELEYRGPVADTVLRALPRGNDCYCIYRHADFLALLDDAVAQGQNVYAQADFMSRLVIAFSDPRGIDPRRAAR